MNAALRVTYGQHSDKGCKPVNQDAHGIGLPTASQRVSKGIALALADGISSSAVSQEASAMAVKGFLADYFSTPETWSVRQSAQCVLTALNDWLHARTQRSLSAHESGRRDLDRGYVCTLSAVIVKSVTAHVFHVGDSRVSLLRNGHLEPLTEDHRLWVSDARSYLVRALGIAAHLQIDYRQHALQPGDVLMLTTDGVHEHLSHARLIELCNAPDLDAAARNIVQAALDAGSDDNLTVQLLRIDALPPPGAAESLWQSGALPCPPALRPGMMFEGFQVLRELHVSHRSHVWLVRDRASGAQCVLKVPAVDVLADRAHLDRLLLEEWIARRIDHPNVLKAPPEASPRQSLYTLSEHVQGQTLTHWMQQHPRPALETVRGIVSQIASGLRALHRKSILHQDLRPDNILIDARQQVTLIDFGSAQVAGLEDLADLPTQTAMPGTEQYSAPEYFLGDDASPQSDLFSLGVITYQMLTGHLPYGTQMAGLRRASDPLRYQPASTHNPDVPGWVDAVLHKAVHVQPQCRHAALSEFVHDLSHPQPRVTPRLLPALRERHPALLWQLACFLLLLMHLLR